MTSPIRFFSRILLALSFAALSDLAQAGVAYHVDIDTNGYTGTGSLELTFLGLPNAAPATATVSGFSGEFGTQGDQEGSVTGTFPGQIVFSNDKLNDFWREVTLGNRFGFDVDFDLPVASGADTTFAVSIANEVGYLTPFPVAAFELAPGQAPVVTQNATFAQVAPAAAVPEPASWTLAVGGLLLLGIGRRSRS